MDLYLNRKKLVSIARYMRETNQNFIGEQWVSSADVVLRFSDEDKKIVWKSFNKILFWPG